MADIIPPGFAQVTIPMRHASLARAANVVFGVDAAGQPDANLLADAVQGTFATAMNGLFDSQVTIGPATTTVGQDGGGEPVVGVAGGTNTGGRSGETLPSNVAALLVKRTARGGRRGRGRMYLPWALSDTEVDDVGILTGAALTKLSTAGTALRTNLATANIPMVILHSLGATNPGDPNEVTSLLGDPRVATQRRRLGR